MMEREMDEGLDMRPIRRLLADFDAKAGARARFPHGDAELDAAEVQLGMRLPAAYRAFLREFGGCWAGLEIHGLRNDDVLEARSMLDLTRDFRADGWPLPARCCVFSFDGSGNPIYLDEAGRVCMHDHDAGQTVLLHASFAALMREVTGCAGEGQPS
jgi:hypothetical protein